MNDILFPFFSIPPAVFRIRLTTKCNLHCSFCYLSGSLNKVEENVLTTEEWGKILKTIPFYTIVDITGAEPTLSPSLPFILKYLLERKRKVSLTTNGMDTSDEFVNLIVDYKLSVLMISIDDLPEQHNEIRGHRRSYDNIKKLIDKINLRKKEKGTHLPMVTIKTTILDFNSNHLEEIYNYNKEHLNIDNYSFNLGFRNKARGGVIGTQNLEEILGYNNEFTYNEKTIAATKGSLNKFLTNKEASIKVRPELVDKDYERYIENPGDYGVKSCKRYGSIATLNYDGSLTSCDINYKIGDIREIGFNMKKILKLDGFKKLRSSIKSEFPYVSACEGCCLAKHERKNCS